MYTKIDELMWKDSKLKTISTHSKLMFIYLLSCQHRNVLGLYNLPKYYVQGDLGYSLERVSKGLEELFNNGLVTYDEESETVLINNFLKYNPLENPNQVKGAVKAIQTIPKTQLFYNLVDILNTSNNKYLSDLKTGVENYLDSNGFERVVITVSKQEEVKEEVTVEEKVTENVYRKVQHLSLTLDQFEKLRENYSKSDIDDILDQMENWAKLKTKKSAYLTANTWLKKRCDGNNFVNSSSNDLLRRIANGE